MNSFRVAPHVHSEWSYDGSWTLAKVASAFGHRGYRAVLLAEHDRGFDENRWAAYRNACAQASTSKTLLVPGIEYSDPVDTVHVPVWGDIPFLGEGLETAELLRRVKRVGGLAVLAHPARRNALRQLMPEWLPYLLGVELWNGKYDGFAPNRAAANLLQSRSELLPMVALDFHTARHFRPLAMVLELDRGLTEEAIIEAMRARRTRPTAYRLPAPSFVHGATGSLFRDVERTRKTLLMRARRIRALGRQHRRSKLRLPD
jgi:hypothetical protein